MLIHRLPYYVAWNEYVGFLNNHRQRTPITVCVPNIIDTFLQVSSDTPSSLNTLNVYITMF